MWSDQRLTPQQWAICSYHLKKDREDMEQAEIEKERYRAFLLNQALLAPKQLEAHLNGRDKVEELVEEDLVFHYRAPQLSAAARAALGVGMDDTPALAPTALARGMKNE